MRESECKGRVNAGEIRATEHVRSSNAGNEARYVYEPHDVS